MLTRRNHNAFTLVELMVVLLLMAILTAGVSMSLTGAVRNVQLEDLLDHIASYDGLMREHARRFDRPLQLVIDVDAGRIAWEPVTGETSGANPLVLPRGFEVKRVVLAGNLMHGGEVAVQCSGKPDSFRSSP